MRTKCVLLSNLFEQIAVNSCRESSILFVLDPPLGTVTWRVVLSMGESLPKMEVRTWSKALIGAKKMIAVAVVF